MKQMKRLQQIGAGCLLAVLVALASLLFGMRAFGFVPYAVLTGSMAPQFPVGSMVYLRKTKPEQIKVGDSITFSAGGGKVVVTHQVISIQQDPLAFQTKGIANEVADVALVTPEHLIGRVWFCLPYLGYCTSWLAQLSARYYAIAALVGWLLLTPIPEKSKGEARS